MYISRSEKALFYNPELLHKLNYKLKLNEADFKAMVPTLQHRRWGSYLDGKQFHSDAPTDPSH